MATASSEEELSLYERQRLAHIRRNHEFLVGLGLADASVDPVEALSGGPRKKKRKPTTTTTRVRVPVPPESLRRSARLVGAAAEYSHERITEAPDDYDDDDDDDGPTRRKAARSVDDGESVEAMRAEAMAYLSAVREAQLQLDVDAEEAADDDWRREAMRRWGHLAGGKKKRDWKVFVESRLSRPPPVSPLDFLQEYYAADQWRLLVSCVLMSRVSSWATKNDCISAFFALYPTPTAFALETDWRRTQGAIHSLGLFDDRLKSLTRLTDHFLGGAQDADGFDISLDRASPHKIHGIGPFGYDSWRVFCHDEGPTITLSKGGKGPLEPFVNWRRRHAKAILLDKKTTRPAAMLLESKRLTAAAAGGPKEEDADDASP